MSTPQPLLSCVRVYGEVNVMTFGADPTASVSSSAAFTAAAAECKAKGFSTLYIPTGTYLLDEPWLLENFAGLRIHGDGDRRNMNAGYNPGSTGSELYLVNNGIFGIVFDTCQSCSLDSLTFVGDIEDPETPTLSNGVNIKGGSSAIQIRNCSFHAFDVCLQCGVGTGTEGTDSETVVSNVQFSFSNIGYRTKHIQTLVNRFSACSCTNLDVMFDLDKGGNLTVNGFGGANTAIFVRANLCGGNTGFNEFFNVRLDAIGDWPDTNRTRIFDGVNGGSSYSAFYGLLVGGENEVPTGITRFTLRPGHWVILQNAADTNENPLARPDSPLVSFTGTGSGLAVFRGFNIDVAADARVLIAPTTDPPIAAFARYSFTECGFEYEPTPDAYQTPLYGPNYLMVCESHCFAKEYGLDGVNAFATGGGNNKVDEITVSDQYRAGVLGCLTDSVGVVCLASGLAAMKLTGGEWKFQTAVRVPTLTNSTNNFVTRLGFGNLTNAQPSNGVFFRLQDGDPMVWRAVVVVATTVTAVSTGVTADSSWHAFEIRIDTAGESSFYIDGIRRAVISAFPTATMGLLPLQVDRLSVAAAAERSAQIDYYRYLFRPTNNDKFPPET